MRGEDLVARARALVGARFRPQGRDPSTGVDCIGLAAIAGGVPVQNVRADYRLRENDLAGLEAGLAGTGFLRVSPGEAGDGDLLVVRSGFAQLHLVILTPGGFVHADAGLRRVVEVPGAVAWPVVSAWREGEEGGSLCPHPPLALPAGREGE